MGKYFGTDGIRGPVGSFPLTPEGISRIAQSAARWALSQGTQAGRPLVVVGSDPRAASDWIVPIIESMLAAHGLDVWPLGRFATTPHIAFETRNSRAVLGLAITASHNKHTDHGIKFFGSDGFKLSGEDQARLEEGLSEPTAQTPASGEAGTVDSAAHTGGYDAALRASLGAAGDLRGLSLVIDASNGAAQRRVTDQLAGGAEWKTLIDPPIMTGVEADTLNINAGVGATHPEAVSARVVEAGAYAGIALDGDADRLIMCDEAGKIIDGDQLIGLLATAMLADGRLKGGGVVLTVMSNLGLEQYLKGLGLNCVRTGVGDRHVVEAMRAGGFNLGGEQSGHIVMLDHTTTGDGVLAALHVLAIAKADGRAFSQIANVFEPVPQKLVNVRYSGADPLETAQVKAAMASATERLGETGRILVRKSGTEPLIRIMVEAVDHDQLTDEIARLEQAVLSVV